MFSMKEDRTNKVIHIKMPDEATVRQKLLDLVRVEYGEHGLLWHKVFALLKASIVLLRGTYPDANIESLWEQCAIAMLEEAADSRQED